MAPRFFPTPDPGRSNLAAIACAADSYIGLLGLLKSVL